ncbi:MAG: phosphoglycolate phosphatase [Methanomicrobiales archaeon]|nr:phosphoglycolate phosphatase [Methanomicrobiales archaeon]
MLKALLTDIDGTLTGPDRRVHTGSIDLIRSLVDRGICVVFASGNSPCFMDAFCRMIGNDGTFIAENGGVFRIGFAGELVVNGNQAEVKEALAAVQAHFRNKSIELDLFSPGYRYADQAFARTVPVDEVRQVLAGHPVEVLDTGFAIHLHTPGINKGTALAALAPRLGLEPADFLAIGDSCNDLQMLATAGASATPANGHPELKAIAHYISEKKYGDGFSDAVRKFF